MMHRDATAAANSTVKDAEDKQAKEKKKDGSIIIVLATDVSFMRTTKELTASGAAQSYSAEAFGHT